MNIRPLGDRVIVRQRKPEDRSEGGIIIPEKAQQHRAQGTVLKVGPGLKDDEGLHIQPDVQPGDVVVYAKYAGERVEVEDGEVVVLHEPDILFVVESVSGEGRDAESQD